MSSTVRRYGFVALLDDPLTEEECEELSEVLYDDKSCLNINYEGTLVYIDFNQHEPYDVRENIYGLTLGNTTAEGKQKFIKELEDNGIMITAGTIQPFDEIYWDGADSTIDLITADEYLKAIGFN